MIDKLQGREKVQWIVVSNKINEIIDFLNFQEAEKQKEQNKKQDENQ